MTALTAAQRKAAERARHKAAGRVAVTVHVLPVFTEQVRKLEKRLRAREKK